MRWIVARFACALALAAAAPVTAQTWTALGPGPGGSQASVDPASVAPEAGSVAVWARLDYPADQKDTNTGDAYRTVIFRQVNDCTARAWAVGAMTLEDKAGVIVSTRTYEPATWHFTPVGPGSASAQIQQIACSSQPVRPAAQAPSVKTGPGVRADWRFVSTGAVDRASYYVDYSSLTTESDGHTVTFFAKGVSGAPIRLDGIGLYTSTYSLWAIDCAQGAYTIYASDFYNVGDQFIGASTEDPDHPQISSIMPDSIAAAIQSSVCGQPSKPAPAAPRPPQQSAQGQPQPSGEPQLSSGTAWLGPKGYLITAAHVIDGAAEIELAQNGEQVGTAQVVVADPANDVAVLKPKFDDPRHHPSIPFADAPAMLGERVFTLGYPAPDELGLDVKMTSGEVSALSGLDVASQRTDDARLLQVSIPIQPGNSGGPVLDDNGRVVGIVVSSVTAIDEKTAAQNVNYALKIGYVRNLLAELPDLGGERLEKHAASLTGVVAEVQPSVFLIVVSTPPAQNASN